MGIERIIGDKLFLNLQLHDGTDTMPKRVIVDIYDEAGALVESSIELPHRGGGLFSEDTELMPDKPFVVAQYRVVEADGSTISTFHSQEVDRFDKADPIDLPEFVTPKPFALQARVREDVRAKVIIKNNRIKIGVRDE